MADHRTGLPTQPPDDGGSLDEHEAQWGAHGTGAAPSNEAAEPAEPADAEPEPTPEAPDDAPPPEAIEEPAAEDAPPDEPARDDAGKFKTRQPAKKDQATPKDVPRIQALAAKVKALEAEKAAWQATQIPAPPPVQAVSTQTIAAPAPVASTTPPIQLQPVAAPVVPLTRPKPSEAQIGDTYPTYADFTEDLATWKYEQLDAQRTAQQADQRVRETQQTWSTQYTAQLAAQRQLEPDFDQVLASVAHIPLTDVMRDAIQSSAQGAAITSWLARHPADFQALVTDSLAVNTYSAIPIVRRVLESKLVQPAVAAVPRPTAAIAGTTGSTIPPARPPAPRPPNPVRTGPLKIGDDPPDDDSSLDAHDAYYYKSRR